MGKIEAADAMARARREEYFARMFSVFKRNKPFILALAMTILVSAYIGFIFVNRPLSPFHWDDPWYHFIPIALSTVWVGIVFIWISPIQKALDIIGLGIFGAFTWHRLFSWLVTKKYFDFNFSVFSFQQGLQFVLGAVVLALCVLMLTGIFSFILLIQRKE